jgi:hypothetical protein
MRQRKEITLRRREILALPLILVFFSCAPKFVPVEIKPAADLPLFDESKKLKIGVSPYIDPKQSRKTFGIDLFSKEGILPILVRIENNTGSDFLLEQKVFSLSQRGNDESSGMLFSSTTNTTGKKVGSSPDYVVITSSRVLGTAGVATFSVTAFEAGGATKAVSAIQSAIQSLHIPVLAVSGVAAIILSIEGERVSRDIQIINHMTAVELADQTLLQGESIQGFLYFKWDSSDETIRTQELVLHNTLQSINEEKVWQVDFPLGRLFPQE